jgi:CheY-like chemotaxis protein
VARIVIAEDDADVTGLLQTLLATLEHDVVFFSDGVSALAECRRQRPDLALLDVVMPGMTGLEVLRDIRADLALHDLPVVLLSARVLDQDIALGRQAGATAYVTKPFRVRRLSDLVQRILAGDPVERSEEVLRASAT